MAEGDAGGLAGELLGRLAGAGQRRAGSDGVDADAFGGEGEGHLLGEGPEGGFGDGVGDEMGGEGPDALVEHVDDGALGGGGEGAGHGLHQDEGGAEVGLEVTVPAGAGGVGPFVALEKAGVVDEDADGAEGGGGAGDEGGGGGLVGEVGLEGDGLVEFGRQCFGLGLAGAVMDGDAETGGGEGARDGCAHALRAAGDEGGSREAGGDGQGEHDAG